MLPYSQDSPSILCQHKKLSSFSHHLLFHCVPKPWEICQPFVCWQLSNTWILKCIFNELVHRNSRSINVWCSRMPCYLFTIPRAVWLLIILFRRCRCSVAMRKWWKLHSIAHFHINNLLIRGSRASWISIKITGSASQVDWIANAKPAIQSWLWEHEVPIHS